MARRFTLVSSPLFATLRHSNVGGADFGGEPGEMQDPKPHLIPCSIAAHGSLLAELKGKPGKALDKQRRYLGCGSEGL